MISRVDLSLKIYSSFDFSSSEISILIHPTEETGADIGVVLIRYSVLRDSCGGEFPNRLLKISGKRFCRPER